MADHIRIRKSEATWVVRAVGAVLGETKNALELFEGDYPPVIYIPRKDLAMALFDKTATSTHCPHKGDASYYTLEAKSGPVKDAAWSYENPKDGVGEIAGYLAFDGDKVTVEKL